MSDSDQETFKDYNVQLDQIKGPIMKEAPIKIKVQYHKQQKQIKPYYDKTKFSFNTLFFQVIEHRKQFQGIRYDDTINDNTMSISMRNKFSFNKSAQRQKMRQGSNSSSNNILSDLNNDSSWQKYSAMEQINQQKSDNKLGILEELNIGQQQSQRQSQKQVNEEEDEYKNVDGNQQQEQKLSQQDKKQRFVETQQKEMQKAEKYTIFQEQFQTNDIMQLNMSGIQGNQSFKKLQLSFSGVQSRIMENEEEQQQDHSQDQQLEGQERQQKLKQVQSKQLQKIIIKFKYQNCKKINITCISHQLIKKGIKPRKIQQNSYLKITNHKFITYHENSDLQMWEIGQSKIPIQILGISMGCHCRKSRNFANSHDRVFSAICENKQCMKPMNFQILDIVP